ncbi:N-alpha-acetyltransferase 30 [Microbotryomycetes sp. JL221]|nr:N-alpha-acetyltransferase 30 [Microbotryomycetes sp. JL221]
MTSIDPPSLVNLTIKCCEQVSNDDDEGESQGVIDDSNRGDVHERRTQTTTSSPMIGYRRYKGEHDIPVIMSLVDSELSEPYNWYTYRYFLQDWPNLCFFAYNVETNQDVATILCKQDLHRDKLNRGYLAMLSVQKPFRNFGVATKLVQLAITEMLSQGAQEIVLETEHDNKIALKFYSKFGFIRDKRLFRFYLNSKDAFRLKLKLTNDRFEVINDDMKSQAKRLVDKVLQENQHSSNEVTS